MVLATAAVPLVAQTDAEQALELREAQQREWMQARRVRNTNAQFRRREIACYQRFAVNDCLNREPPCRTRDHGRPAPPGGPDQRCAAQAPCRRAVAARRRAAPRRGRHEPPGRSQGESRSAQRAAINRQELSRPAARAVQRLQLDHHQRQVVAGPLRALARLVDQELGCLACGQAVEHVGHLAVVEVVPDTVAAGDQAVAHAQPRYEVDVHRRLGLRAQAAHQDVGLGMHVGLLFGDLAALDQHLHVGMVCRAPDHLAAMEVVDARVA